jgi:hypothetical protein
VCQFLEPPSGYRHDQAAPTLYRACRMYLLLCYLYRPTLFLDLSHQLGHISCCLFTGSDFAIEKYLHQILHRKLLNPFAFQWSLCTAGFKRHCIQRTDSCCCVWYDSRNEHIFIYTVLPDLLLQWKRGVLSVR